MDDNQQERLEVVLRHIEHVKSSCFLLGHKLIAEGDSDLGLRLIANGQVHDNSKLHGIEWQYLHADVKKENQELWFAAMQSHWANNPHHPEYWVGGIKEMPSVYIAEMCCDWHGRSSEFGTDLWDWVKKNAMEKYGFTASGKVYKEVKRYLDLLLEKKFQ